MNQACEICGKPFWTNCNDYFCPSCADLLSKQEAEECEADRK